jgi:hypothetical protein
MNIHHSRAPMAGGRWALSKLGRSIVTLRLAFQGVEGREEGVVREGLDIHSGAGLHSSGYKFDQRSKARSFHLNSIIAVPQVICET